MKSQRRGRSSRSGKLLADIYTTDAGRDIDSYSLARRLDLNAARQLQRERHGSKGKAERVRLRTVL